MTKLLCRLSLDLANLLHTKIAPATYLDINIMTMYSDKYEEVGPHTVYY